MTTQIENLKNILTANVDEYLSNNKNDYENKETCLRECDDFLERLKKCTHFHLDTFSNDLGLSPEDKKIKKEEQDDEIFYADDMTPTQILWKGKKHRYYYQIHLTDFQNLINDSYLVKDYLKCRELDDLILKIYIYYHVIATGEQFKEGVLSFSKMAVYHYSKGGAIMPVLFKYLKDILFVGIFFCYPIYHTTNSYFNNDRNFELYFSLTLIWIIIFFPRYLISKYQSNRELEIKDKKYEAYNNLWIACFHGPVALEYMKNNIQNLISSRNMIFESGLKIFIDNLIERYGKYF